MTIRLDNSMASSELRQRRNHDKTTEDSGKAYLDGDDESVESSSSDQSETSSSRDSKGTNHTEDVRAAAAASSKHLNYLRYTVLVLILVTGILVSTGTYLALNAQEVSTSDNQYTLYIKTMDNTYGSYQMNIRDAISTLTDSITSTADALHQKFPYVTLNNEWEIAARHFSEDTGAEMVFFMPLVTNVSAWNSYSARQDWWSDSIRLAKRSRWLEHPDLFQDTGRNPLYILNGTNAVENVPNDRDVHLPLWMMSPPPINTSFINFDMLSLPWMERILASMMVLDEPLLTEVMDFSWLIQMALTPQEHLQSHDLLGNRASLTEETAFALPHSLVVAPVKSHLVNGTVAGVLGAILPWERYLTNAVPEGVGGIMNVLENSCGQAFTYEIDGNTPTYVGPSDLHETQYDGTQEEILLTDWNASYEVEGHCSYRIEVYTSTEYWSESVSNTPVLFTIVVASTFLLVLITFTIYDLFVRRRQSKLVDAALRSHAMIASLFPSNVRSRLFQDAKGRRSLDMVALPALTESSKKPKSNTLKGFLTNESNDDGGETLGYEGKPIADLFPDTTVLFADIAGFTAWSSVREPVQVFTLLETLYRAFDETAKRRRVFKVETVGDCYVAVTGLPEPRKDHAVAMARFARECMAEMQILTKRLEITLGPDTGDLDLRVGLHSGPVTAGVLRGERSRFQLFGDTMNTASRMESNGIKGRIQVSEDTAELLRNSGKGRWLKRRAEMVVAKGKGEMQTYWLVTSREESEPTEGSTRESEKSDTQEMKRVIHSKLPSDDKTTRLIEWNVEVLLRFLKQIEAKRRFLVKRDPYRKADADESAIDTDNHMVIDEVREIITLPDDNYIDGVHGSLHDVTLHPAVSEELTDFVSNIATLYNDNPFHNYEHASHVTMSVVKLLSRIVAPSENEYDENGKTLHDHTYGITSDPLTQFACVLAALIHDVDHQGVPNAQLIAEKTHLARHYQGRSVAEQNSLDLSWNLLMDESYRNLRNAIYTTHGGLVRFRQLLVNSVMATDIVDKELKTLRNARWDTAFSKEHKDEDPKDTQNRKATIVIEHLLQASDVSHTMQHWHIYRKWNERFFIECYKAFKEGRAEKNPSEGWYQGELGFFDFYIIPLAKKLKDCGVFGVSSDEYLNYAVRNRKEWEERGREVVDEMVEKVKKMECFSPSTPEAAPSPASDESKETNHS